MATRRKIKAAAEPKAAAPKRNGAKKPKTKASAPGGKALQGMGPVERTLDQMRELFLQHRGPWNAINAQLKLAQKRLADLKAEIKADGFKVRQFQIADQLGDVKGEARVTAEVDDVLRVARWMGHPLGNQLDLFNEPDRTPIVDRAFDEGRMASMQNQPRKPGYAPDHAAYGAWMEGYAAHQAELGKGFKAKQPASPQHETAH